MQDFRLISLLSLVGLNLLIPTSSFAQQPPTAQAGMAQFLTEPVVPATDAEPGTEATVNSPHRSNEITTNAVAKESPADQSIARLLEGKSAFTDHCMKCHDAHKSLTVSHSYNEWLITIEAMSEKDDANIPATSFKPIATYLTLIAGATVASKSEQAATEPKAKPNASANTAQGSMLFTSQCTTCHDAEKSTSKSKSVGDWRLTVQRMAGKQGANIPSSSIEPISAYLASLAANGKSTSGGDTQSDPQETSSGFSISGTLSPTWRGGNDNLQNGGFFPDAWLGINWDSGKELSGRMTACVTCHVTEDGQGDRIELVEAALRYDLGGLFNPCLRDDLKASVEAGRFIVPFGAFASQSNPGVYRTVSRPLIFNMGQRVQDEDLGDPVLPMPFSDEGANLNLSANLTQDIQANWIGYVINGLQSDRDGINFDQSRDYVANNHRPTWGTRATVSLGRLRIGSSLLTGQSSPSGGFENVPQSLYYKIYGYDATYLIPNVVRLQFEYARRDSDRVAPDPAVFRVTDRTSGYYFEGEVWHPQLQRLSFISRYDSQDRKSDFAPGESSIGLGTFGIQRFSYGLNINMRRGGLLMINHERWFLPGDLKRTDVLGMRWAYTF